VDVVVIGAGLNGLVAGAYLAGRRRSVVILDQRPIAGGAAITTEFTPGYRVPTLSHSLGPVSRDVVRALHLDRTGLEFRMPEPTLTTLGPNGTSIVFHRDPVLTAGSINRLASSDAVRWSEFLKFTQRVSSVVSRVSHQAPPAIDDASTRAMLRLLSLGRSARGLGRRDLARLMRWVPMPVADLAAEWFDSDLIRAALSAHAIFGNPIGPMSAGSGAMLLQHLGVDPHPLGSGAIVRGGPGALTAAVAKIAETRGATIRTSARVIRILSRGGQAKGVVLENGDELPATAVVSAIDPKRTFTKLVDPVELPSTFLDRVRCIRARGVTAKINLALKAPPVLAGFEGDPVPLRGRLLIAPDVMYLERAYDAIKYGEMSPDPWLEISIPTMTDSSLSDEGHVVSIYVHFAPRHLRQGSWSEKKEELYRAALRVLEPHMPSLSSLVIEREIWTPEDLETQWGLTGGHIFHGELALDQTWIGRPVLGWAQYRTPIDRLFLAGAGTHPGGGLTGLPGLLGAKAADQLMGK
jgi:phytoene dehydrogenase-like protein